jgi:hypothetical protein
MAARVRPMLFLASALVVATVVACTTPAASRAQQLATLYVNYTNSCTFTITNDSGGTVSSVAPGNYNVEINTPEDFANAKQDAAGQGSDNFECNGSVQFQLTGPGVSLATTLDDGSNTYALLTADLLPSSTYTAVDNNVPSATVSFTTTSSGTPVTPAAPTNPASQGTQTTSSSGGQSSSSSVGGTSVASTKLTFKGTLAATVSVAGKLTLTFKGKRVSSLVEGKYTISVVDHSKTSGFVVQEVDGLATTVSSAAFVGTRHASVSIGAGQWLYYPSFIGKKTYFVVTR